MSAGNSDEEIDHCGYEHESISDFGLIKGARRKVQGIGHGERQLAADS
jgi:hypothetical protein